MRKAEFTVPQETAVAFAEEIVQGNLSNEIIGITDENELLIEVSYTKEQGDDIDELESHLENLIDEIGEEKV